MELEFTNPWALLLLAVGIWLTWLIDRRYRRKGKSLKRTVTMAARFVVHIALALAIAAPSMLIASGDAARWVLLDLSDSTRAHHGDMQSIVSNALKSLPEGERVGVIAFGETAMVLAPASDAPTFSGTHAEVGGAASDASTAMSLAAALLPSGGAGGISVLTDGRITLDASVREMLLGRGIRVDVLPVDATDGADAQVSQLTVPTEAYIGQKLSLNVVIDANEAMDGTLALYQNGQITDTRTVALTAGENRFAFTDTAVASGMITYEARLLSQTDSCSQNNSASAYTRVAGAPSLLVISQTEAVSNLFEAAGMQVHCIQPQQMPDASDGYTAYDAIVLNNINYDTASERQWIGLGNAVRQLGRGLVVLGGDDSYALGGYRGTLLEELLPVSLDVRQKQRMPALSLVIAIDKSGSMTDGQYGLTRIEVAKEAAMSAIEVLAPQDFVGVIGFDSAAKWVVPFQSASDLTGVQEMIGTLRADGGTEFYSALDEAYRALATSDTPQKHVIFLSDGQPGDTGFESIALSMQKSGITLTTVAVGGGADQNMMKLLSTLGGGRSYVVDEFDSIPKIFTKETMLVSGSYLQNRTFTPVIVEDSALTRFDGFPTLDGYQTAVEKPVASVSLVSDMDDPLLCWHRAGSGKVLAWMSDAEGAWTQSFLAWQDAPAFYGVMAAQVLPSVQSGGELTASVDNDSLHISYAASEADAQTIAQVLLPDGTRHEAALIETAPGVYQAQVEAMQQGAYVIRVTQTRDGVVIGTAERGAIRGFSGEYDIRQGETDELMQLSQDTGGRELEGVDDFWLTPVTAAATRKSLQGFLVLAAFILFLVDIALRRLPWETLIAKHSNAAKSEDQPKPAASVASSALLSKSSPKQERQKCAEETTNALLEAKRRREQK